MKPYVICHMNSSVDGRILGSRWRRRDTTGTGSPTFSKLRRPRSSRVNAPPTRAAIAPLLIRISPSCAEATRLAEDSAKCQFGWGRGPTDPSSQRGTDSSNPFPSSAKSCANATSSERGPASIYEHKARVAAKYRRPTRAFEDAVQKFDFKFILSLDDIVASRGGIPLIEDGKIIGAVGCSGGTGSQDEAICTAAAALVNK
jgi:Haem-degrading